MGMKMRSTNSRPGSQNKNMSSEKSKNISEAIAKGVYNADLKPDRYYKAGLEGLYVGKVLFTTTMTKGVDRRRLSPSEKKKLTYMEHINYSYDLFWEDQALDFSGNGLPKMFTLKDEREKRRQKNYVPDEELLCIDWSQYSFSTMSTKTASVVRQNMIRKKRMSREVKKKRSFEGMDAI